MSRVDISKTRFPEKLRRLRIAAGLTQKELAEKAGLTPRAIFDIEKGNRERVQEKTLLLIADALSVTVEDLLEDPAADKFQAGGALPSKAIIVRMVIAVLVIVSLLIIYKYVNYLSSSRARLAINRGAVEVYDGVFGFLRWSEKHNSNISTHDRITWQGKQTIIYGLDAKASDGGLLFVRDIRSGKRLWEAKPDPPGLDCIFAKDALDACGFGVRGIFFTDFYGDGDPELVVYYIHGKYYPCFVSVFNSKGRRIGTYYHFGHFNDVHPDDIDNDGKQELIIAGTTNREEYEGATALILDDAFGEGASVDSLVRTDCDLRDIAATRIIFPNFNERIMKLLGAERLRAKNIITSFHDEGSPTITIGVGHSSFEVVITLDNQLKPLSYSVSDDLSVLIGKLPPSERPTEKYFNEWLSKSIRFERKRLVAVDP